MRVHLVGPGISETCIGHCASRKWTSSRYARTAGQGPLILAKTVADYIEVGETRVPVAYVACVIVTSDAEAARLPGFVPRRAWDPGEKP